MNPPLSSKPSSVWRSTGALVLGALIAAVSCSTPRGEDITGETHFLRLCDAEANDCGAGLVCACGVCTRVCEVSSDCAAFPSADCIGSSASPAPQMCEDPAPAGRCDVTCVSDADCGVVSSEHRCNLGALGGARPLDPRQLLGAGAQQAGEAAEGAEQLLGELKDAGADKAGAQQERDQLGVGERCRPQGEQLFARPGRSGNVLQHVGSNRGMTPARKMRSSLSPERRTP